MTTPIWPAALPQFVLERGYSEQLPDVLLEFEPDVGQPKTRRQFTTNWIPIAASIFCEAGQAAVFDAFYTSTLKGGALEFIWVHPRTQDTAYMRFRGGPPSRRVDGGGNVTISFAVWVLRYPSSAVVLPNGKSLLLPDGTELLLPMSFPGRELVLPNGSVLLLPDGKAVVVPI